MNEKWKKRIALLAISMAGNTIYLLPYIQYTFYDKLLNALNVSNSKLGTLLMVYSIVGLCSIFFGGMIVDRFDNRKIVVISLLAQTAVNIWFAFNITYVNAIITWILLGFTAGCCFWPALNRCLNRLYQGEALGSTYGWYYCLNGICGMIVGAIAVAAANNVSEEKSLTCGFLVVAASTLIAAVVFWFAYEDNVGEATQISEDDKMKWSEFGTVLKSPYPWLIGIIGFLAYTIYSSNNSYFNAYLVNVRGVEPMTNELMGVIRTYGFTFIGILGGWLADKVIKSTSKLLIIVHAFVLVGYFGLMFLPLTATSATAFTLLLPAIVMTAYTIRYSITREMPIDPRLIGTTIGVASFLTWLPDVVNPVILGSFLDKWGNDGYNYIFVYLMACTVLLMFFCGIVVRMYAKMKKEKKDA